ncbi:MAG: hypothetical protein ACW980_22535 [Promethearchaeota archaeon]
MSTNHDTCYKKCEYCYNHKSIKQYKAVSINYDRNTQSIIKREKLPFVPKSRNLCRISINGDFSFKNNSDSVYYIREWIRLAKHHNGIKGHKVEFFGYTKSWQDKKLVPYLQELNSLPNVNIKCSVDALTGIRIPKGFKKAGIVYGEISTLKPLKGQFICQFGNKNSKLYKVTCQDCRVCINKKTQVDVYFPSH